MSQQRALRREQLRQGGLFQKLDDPALDALVDASRTQALKRKQELFHKGDQGSQIYLILNGRLKVSTTSPDGDDVVFNIMGPGEVVGELALLVSGERTGTVEAIDDSELLVLDRRDFLPLMKRHPEAAITLLETLAERVVRISQLFEDTHFLNLPIRLAKMLEVLCSRFGVDTNQGVRIDLPLSQTELGDLVATTRESINKQIKAWREAGIAHMEGGYVTVLDRDRLADIADGAED